MITFSPSYNTLTVAVLETKSEPIVLDSMHSWDHPKNTNQTSWKEWNFKTETRPLNKYGVLPISGAFVACYRGLTAVADVIAGLVSLLFGKEGDFQVKTGALNLMRSLIEGGPLLIVVYANKIPFSSSEITGLFFVAQLIRFAACAAVDNLHRPSQQDFSSKEMPVLLFYDKVYAAGLRPEGCINSYSYEGWISEIQKYGKRTREYVRYA